MLHYLETLRNKPIGTRKRIVFWATVGAVIIAALISLGSFLIGTFTSEPAPATTGDNAIQGPYKN